MDILVVVFETDNDPDGNPYRTPLIAIQRSMDGDDALEKVLQLADSAVIVAGSYADMPDHEFNGPGQFAKAVLAAVNDEWEMYTTIVPISDVLDDNNVPIGEFDLEISVYAPMAYDHNMRVTHSHYDLEETP